MIRNATRNAGVMLLLLAIPIAVVQAQQPAPSTPSPSPAPAAEKIQNGKKHFVTYLCFGCHGYTGQGGTDTGPRIDTNRLTYEAFARYVRKPAGSMPPYGSQKQLPDLAMEEMYAYLKSLPASPDPKTIPLLSGD
jgi:mono/diheme cytochrome c family protein